MAPARAHARRALAYSCGANASAISKKWRKRERMLGVCWQTSWLSPCPRDTDTRLLLRSTTREWLVRKRHSTSEWLVRKRLPTEWLVLKTHSASEWLVCKRLPTEWLVLKTHPTSEWLICKRLPTEWLVLKTHSTLEWLARKRLPTEWLVLKTHPTSEWLARKTRPISSEADVVECTRACARNYGIPRRLSVRAHAHARAQIATTHHQRCGTKPD